MNQSRSSPRKPPAVMALIAHDTKKDALTAFCQRNRQALEGWQLVATGTTGKRIAEATGLLVECVLSGPLGGDAQIAARVAAGEVGAVIFIVELISMTILREIRTSRPCSASATSMTYRSPPTSPPPS